MNLSSTASSSEAPKTKFIELPPFPVASFAYAKNAEFASNFLEVESCSKWAPGISG